MSIAYKKNGVWVTASGTPSIDNALSATSENAVQNKIVKAAIENSASTLQQNFQAGVDDVYDAVVAKGSTPASKSLSDVIAGIGAIDTALPTQEKSCTPTASQQEITPDSGKTLSKVIVAATPTQTKSATPSITAQTITPDSGKFLSSVSVGAISTQEKSCTPSTSAQTITPDSGKFLSKVSVAAVNYSLGFIEISNNGYDSTFTPKFKNVRFFYAAQSNTGSQIVLTLKLAQSGKSDKTFSIYAPSGWTSGRDTTTVTPNLAVTASISGSYRNTTLYLYVVYIK